MLEMPMSEIAERIPLDSETKAPAPGRERFAATHLPVEAGAREWPAGSRTREAAHGACDSFQMDADAVAGFYWQSEQWGP